MHAGADLEARATAGITPLHAASHWGHTKVVIELAAVSAKLDTRDDNGLTALDHTDFKGQLETANALRFAQANPNINLDLFLDWTVLLDIRETLAGDAFLDWAADVPIEKWDGVTLGGSP